MPLRARPCLILLALAAALPGAAAAQAVVAPQAPARTVTRDLPVTGNAPPLCTLSAPVVSTANDSTQNFSGEGNSLSIQQLVDQTTLSTRAATVTLALTGLCNYPHAITLSSDNNGLWGEQATAPASGFGNAVPYTARLRWGELDQTVALTALGRANTATSFNLATGVGGIMRIGVDVTAGATNTTPNAPLVAGTYRDTLRITIGPNEGGR